MLARHLSGEARLDDVEIPVSLRVIIPEVGERSYDVPKGTSACHGFQCRVVPFYRSRNKGKRVEMSTHSDRLTEMYEDIVDTAELITLINGRVLITNEIKGKAFKCNTRINCFDGGITVIDITLRISSGHGARDRNGRDLLCSRWSIDVI
ncbi:hypothetical protein J6590_078587 [Homalodisca vitripennis]|nr:hypothetical protein J6590_078587 [Homalodisca vitripennis]